MRKEIIPIDKRRAKVKKELINWIKDIQIELKHTNKAIQKHQLRLPYTGTFAGTERAITSSKIIVEDARVILHYSKKLYKASTKLNSLNRQRDQIERKYIKKSGKRRKN